MIIKRIYWYFKNKYKKILMYRNPRKLASILYYDTFKKHINWKKPKDLNEKINWLAFNTDTALWSLCADKYRIREYIKDKKCDELLVNLYGKYDSAKDIDFDNLPEKFVLKPNHGYGNVIIVKDKSQINKEDIIKQLQEAIDTPWGYETAEPHYLRIKPCIIAEELLEVNKSYGLVDYKVWCFNGKPYYIFTGSNRNVVTHEVIFNLFDLDWNRLDNYMSSKYRNNVYVPKPVHLDEILRYAEVLSEPFPIVRVDFYEVSGKVYIGELTFTSNMGRMDFYTDEALLKMGNIVNLKNYGK